LDYYYYPAIRIDTFGSVLLVYGTSRFSSDPGVQATGQKYNDPPNSWEPIQVLQNGAGPIDGAAPPDCSTCVRWGDYFAAGVDPSSGLYVWVLGLYGTTTSTTYGSWIAKLSVN